MPDYKQTSVEGQKWSRFGRVVIDNPRNAAPSVICVEQEVISLAGNEIVRDIGNLNFPFDPNAEFPIKDPATNLPTGQMATGAQLYALVWSCVMNQADLRDDAADAAQAAAQAAAEAAASQPPAEPAP